MRRGRLLIRKAVLAAGVVLGLSIGAAADPVHGQVTASPMLVQFPDPGSAEFMAGFIYQGPLDVTVTVPGNKKWDLYWEALAPTLGGYGKPVSHVEVRLDGSTTWFTLSAVPQILVSGRGQQTIRLHLRVMLSMTQDLPDTYQVAVRFEER